MVFFAYNFFVSKFLQFYNSFEISIKFCVVLIPLFKFCKKSFWVMLALFWNFKSQCARNGSQFWKCVLQKCLRITILFTPIYPWTPISFLKKHDNRCTLVRGRVRTLRPTIILFSNFYLNVLNSSGFNFTYSTYTSTQGSR